MKNEKLSQIMSPATVTVDINSKIEDVKRLFETHHLHHIPVTKNGKLAGIVSLTDYLRVTLGAELTEKGETFDNDEINTVILSYITVEKMMTAHPVSLNLDSTVSDAIKLFEINMFHAIPVVDNEKIAGIVSTLDLIKYMKKFID